MGTATKAPPNAIDRSKRKRREILARNAAERQPQQRQGLGSDSNAVQRKIRQRRVSDQPSRRTPQRPRTTSASGGRAAEPNFESDEGFHFTLAHAFVILGHVVGLGLFATFGLDLLLKIPFQRASIMYDVTNVVGGLTLMYLSWNCQRELD